MTAVQDHAHDGLPDRLLGRPEDDAPMARADHAPVAGGNAGPGDGSDEAAAGPVKEVLATGPAPRTPNRSADSTAPESVSTAAATGKATDASGPDTNPTGLVIEVADESARTTLVNEHSGQPRHDLPVLEAFRGLAAIMVVFTHVGFISGAGMAGAWAGWLSRLDFGVALFFLLSGFLLFRPFVQAAYDRRPRVEVRSYLRRRFVRIYPAFIVVMAADYLITPEARQAHGGMWLQTLLMWQNYTVNFVNQVPGLVQVWSLAVEVSYYVALPMLAWVILGRGTTAATASTRAALVRGERRARTPAQIRQAALERSRRPWPTRLLMARPWSAEAAALRPGIVLATLTVLSLGWRLYYMVTPGGMDNQLLWLPAFIDWFSAGMALAWLRERQARLPQWIRDVANSPGACWSLALAGFWLSTTKLAGPYGLDGPSPAEAMLKHIVFLLIATLLLLPAVFGDTAASWRRVACNRFFSWLGQISFGVFLWHPMLMGAIRRMLRLTPIGGGFWLTLTLTLIASAIAGTLSWRFVEEPLQRRWRNGFFSGQRAPAPNRRQIVIIRKGKAQPQAARTAGTPTPAAKPAAVKAAQSASLAEKAG